LTALCLYEVNWGSSILSLEHLEAFRAACFLPACDIWTRSRKISLWHRRMWKRQFPTCVNISSLEPSRR